jgi:hypothetical protein
MTKDEADARCAALNSDETEERQWFVRQAGPDSWDLVSVAVSGLQRRGPLKEAVESTPRPSEPPDPRPTIFRHVPPYGAG